MKFVLSEPKELYVICKLTEDCNGVILEARKPTGTFWYQILRLSDQGIKRMDGMEGNALGLPTTDGNVKDITGV